MIEKLKHKYALSEKGAKDMVRAFVAVTLANLALMVPVGLLYVLASCLLDGSLPKEKLPFFIIGIIAALLLIIVTTYFQYNSTFMATYVVSGVRRRTLAEKLRKLPLSFFGKKDLSDLTNTLLCPTVHCSKQPVPTGFRNLSVHFYPQQLLSSACLHLTGEWHLPPYG